MNDFWTFLITSTISTPAGVFDPRTRYIHTLDTIASIKRKVPDAKIVLIDNSSESLPDELVAELRSQVDHFEQVKHNLVSLMFNNQLGKGLGEIYMMWELMQIIKQKDLIGKRIFKLSGRYLLCDSFDITAYEDPKLHNKYVAQINVWDVSKDNWRTRETVVYFETRLWSFCGSLYDEYLNLIPQVFNHMISQDNNLEKTYFKLFDHNKIVEFKPIHVEGLTADTGNIKVE